MPDQPSTPPFTEPPDSSDSAFPARIEAPPIYRKTSSAHITRSNWSLLGRTQGQRAAEIMAAMRAKFDPTPEHLALRRAGAEALINAYIKDPKTAAFILARPKLFEALIERELIEIKSPVIVEMAAGFLPRGFSLATRHPDWKVIEVDLPEVMQEKRFRLEANDFVIPPNLIMLGADLTETSLREVIGDEKVHIVTAEGLMPFFTPDDQQQCAEYVIECLCPGGNLIFDMTWASSVVPGNDAARVMNRQAGSFLTGFVNDEAEAKSRFGALGFQSVMVYRPSQLIAEMRDLPAVADGVLIVIGHKGTY